MLRETIWLQAREPSLAWLGASGRVAEQVVLEREEGSGCQIAIQRHDRMGWETRRCEGRAPGLQTDKMPGYLRDRCP
jgi:hypothetical protein